MVKKVKEEEKIEKIIRGLLKLPENRRCINCNSLGPQYVCTTFLTFVCTNCSGVHREFTHRVKSVSMAKFNAEEASALQAGGNERAREIYFKGWDPQRNSLPDGSNLRTLRDFIKHVYVDRKYSGERSMDNIPRLRLNNKEESYENRKGDGDTSRGCHSEKSSPCGRNDEKNFRYYYDERRSPRFAQENSRYGALKRNPVRIEVVDDRFRDDGFRNGKRSDGQRFSSEESMRGSRSPACQKNVNRSCSPVVRPVRDILGENVPRIHVGNLPKANEGEISDGSAHNQMIVSSSSTGSLDGNQVENSGVNSGSLIDLNSDLEPPVAAAMPQTRQGPQSIDGGDWASFTSANENASHAPNANTLESLLFQLSAPSDVPAGNIPEVPGSGVSPSTVPVGNMLALPSSEGASITTSTANVPSQHPNGRAPEVLQCQPSPCPSVNSSSSAQQTMPVGASNNQLWIEPLASNAHGLSSASAEHSSQAVSKPVQDTSSGVGLQLLPVEANPSGRMELPEDLFTASYSATPAPVPGWQTGLPHGMGFGMQYYPTAVPVSAFPNSAKSMNPFDLNDGTTQVQAPPFASMASLQGALPNVSAPTGLLPSQSSTMPPRSPSYGSNLTQSAYMGQQVSNNMPPSRVPDFSSFGDGGADFGSLNTNEQPSSASSASNPLSSVGGNPFG